MTEAYLFLIAGAVLVGVALSSSRLERFPVSTSNIYLLVGLLLGPGALGLLSWDVVREARLLEHLTEVAVTVSLFTVGLHIRRSPWAPRCSSARCSRQPTPCSRRTCRCGASRTATSSGTASRARRA